MPTVLIYWSPGRTAEQKQKVVEGITQTLVSEGAANVDDVLIIFQEIQPGNAARGGTINQPPSFAATPSERSAAAPSNGADPATRSTNVADKPV